MTASASASSSAKNFLAILTKPTGAAQPSFGTRAVMFQRFKEALKLASIERRDVANGIRYPQTQNTRASSSSRA